MPVAAPSRRSGYNTARECAGNEECAWLHIQPSRKFGTFQDPHLATGTWLHLSILPWRVMAVRAQLQRLLQMFLGTSSAYGVRDFGSRADETCVRIRKKSAAGLTHDAMPYESEVYERE
jgi:hypothetical protein